jgi:hypothetical protein
MTRTTSSLIRMPIRWEAEAFGMEHTDEAHHDSGRAVR